MIEKEIKLTAKFKYLQEEDFKDIKQQVSYFLREHEDDCVDLLHIISEDDSLPYMTDCYIEKGNYKIDIHLNNDIDDECCDCFCIVNLPAKYGDNEDIRKELINYTLYCLFNESTIINRFFKFFGSFSINYIDRFYNS